MKHYYMYMPIMISALIQSFLRADQTKRAKYAALMHVTYVTYYIITCGNGSYKVHQQSCPIICESMLSRLR